MAAERSAWSRKDRRESLRRVERAQRQHKHTSALWKESHGTGQHTWDCGPERLRAMSQTESDGGGRWWRLGRGRFGLKQRLAGVWAWRGETSAVRRALSASRASRSDRGAIRASRSSRRATARSAAAAASRAASSWHRGAAVRSARPSNSSLCRPRCVHLRIAPVQPHPTPALVR